MFKHLKAWLFRSARVEDAKPPEVNREAIEALVGHPIGNVSLYTLAMRHRSALRGLTDSKLESNERLEFLGDAVLGLIVAQKLYDVFPDRDEGFLTRTRAKLVNGQMLAELARAISLGQHLLLSTNLRNSEGRDNATILADAFEAIIGAIYLDLGFNAARQFVLRVIDEHVDLTEISEQRTNFKSLLLERSQAAGRGQPAYEVIKEEGPSHDRRFTVSVLVEGTAYGQGHAKSKKMAEQEAARQALEHFQ